MSEELVAMIDIWVIGFVTVTELPRKIMEKALKEGFDKETIRQIIVSKLRKRGLSDRTIRDKMPKELRLKNYPEKRKKVNEATTNWQNSANSGVEGETEAQLMATVESNEATDGNKPSKSARELIEDIAQSMRNQICDLSELLKDGLNEGLTLKQIDNDLFDAAKKHCDASHLDEEGLELFFNQLDGTLSSAYMELASEMHYENKRLRTIIAKEKYETYTT